MLKKFHEQTWMQGLICPLLREGYNMRINDISLYLSFFTTEKKFFFLQVLIKMHHRNLLRPPTMGDLFLPRSGDDFKSITEDLCSGMYLETEKH